MFFYHLYGLGILSEINFPELIPKKSNIDVVIRFGDTSKLSGTILKEYYLDNTVKFQFISNRIHFFWHDVEIYVIRDGKEIIVNPNAGLDENILKLFILGSALAIILHQKGMLVLHANAININNQAVAFVGPSGSGKSTTSLALCRHGYNLISDDVLCIQVKKNGLPMIFPGFPRLKIWPEVIKNTYKNLESTPKLHYNTDKRSYYVDNFSDSPLPLKAIYLMETGNKTCIKETSSQDSIVELIKSSYCLSIFNEEELSKNLNQCSKIVNMIQIKRLKVRHSFKTFHELVNIIENDILNKNM